VVELIRGIGTDIVDMSRIKIANLDRLAKKILSEKEYSIFEKMSLEKRKLEFFSGRFASKEAFYKSMGTGIRKYSMRDVEILNNEMGAPYVSLKDDLKSHYDIADSNVYISISHDGDYALSFVIVEVPG